MEQKFERIARHLYKRQYQTASGDWSTLYYARFKDWKRVRRTLPLGSDLKTAKEELKVYEARNVRREDFDKDRVRGLTLFPWIERFLQIKASKKSLDKDEVSCDRLKAFFGDCSLDSIITSWVESYKQKRLVEPTRKGTPPAPGTINRELACLRSMLILAARDGLIDKVPYIVFFEEKNERNRTASQEEFEALLRVSPPHLQEVLICIWDTGMRKGETAATLTWDRVDLKKDLIGLGKKDTKTGYARLVPISPRLKSILSDIRQREKGGKVVTMTDHVFLYKGKPFKNFKRSFEAACRKAGIEGLWIHDLRASFATRKIGDGFDRDWVKMITGHKSDNVFKRYNRPSFDALRAVVAGDRCNEVVTQEGTTGAETHK